jgi:hypothetical protein
MTDQSKQLVDEPSSSSEAAHLARRPYDKPSLVSRERLSQVTATDSKVSGITTDNA